MRTTNPRANDAKRALSAASAILAAVVLVACSSEPTNDGAATGTASSPLLNGAPPPDNTAVGELVVDGKSVCSAEILSPTLAVTALHCLLTTDIGFENCEFGNKVAITGLVDVGTVQVRGATATSYETTVGVTRYFTEDLTDLCTQDMAILQLSAPIPNLQYPKLRLVSGAAPDEEVSTCGFGYVDAECDSIAGSLCADGKVLANSGGLYGGFIFPRSDIVTSISECFGDSGSGLYSKATGALIGVNRAIWNPDTTKTATPNRQCNYCEGSVTAGNSLAEHRAIIEEAFATTGQAPWQEGHNQPAAVGGGCSSNEDCNSGLCIQVGSQQQCSQSCATSECPSGTTCVTTGGQSVCVNSVTPHPKSCAASPSAPVEGNGLAWAGVFAALVTLARRRRSRSALTSER